MDSNNNKQLFTCVGRGHGSPVRPATRGDWEAMRKEPWLADMCRRIEAGDEKLKHRLPVWTPHCAEFKNNHRAAADALRPLPRLMLDFDEKGHSADILQRALALNEAGRWRVLLVEESVRRGTHVLIALPEGMTPQEAQQRFSADVGFRADSAVKDVSRCIYLVPDDHTLYVDEERLFVPDAPATSPCGDSFLPKEESCEADVPGPPSSPKEESPTGGTAGESDTNEHPGTPTFKGVPYSEIIRQWFALNGGEPVQGERNDKLHRLAYHLRYITDNDESLLLRIMPRYGLSEEEMRGLVRSACQAKWGGMPRLLGTVLKKLGSDPEPEQEETPPPMPKQLPALVELLLSRTPDVYKPAVAHAIFPPLATHLHRVRFRYIDNGEHEATLMCVLAAPTGSGKSCVNAPIDRIMADIRARDEANRQREASWKENNNVKGANKNKESRPEGLVIQWVSPDMTNAAFVMRLSESDDHFLYARMNEIEAFDALRGSSRNPQQFVIMRLAFDTGEYGQERVGEKSVSEQVRIRFNWNASSTPGRVQEYFRKVLVDGPVSRINFCTISEQEIGSEMPVYGIYDEAFDEALRPYIENLTGAGGLVEEPRLTDLARKLYRELNDRAVLSQDRVFDNLSRRALVIGWLKACVLYVANGCRWEESIEDFTRWSVEYDLWCKLRFFGAAIAQAEKAGLPVRHPGPGNMLESLPDVFTKTDLLRLRMKLGMKSEGTRDLLYRWMKRGFIRQTTVI